MKTTTSSAPAARRSLRRARGQGMTEYIIIVALIGISAIGVITLFGDNVKALFGMASDSLAGETKVATRATKSKPEGEKSGGLGHYADHNGY